ncbi:rab GTPase-binding effector protein 1 isoform X2 [Chiloscyllium plagiosum]|uniref:rab GTPase-binding effector protein 1 isoform X2 n=1 Tax=Chiloscyllium plagiosum TaxID=36176 RepID=UPI001CB885A8|nr:rab GTPase-binding effector protein 1 isoform X2 [Chiloscyllium plagiosum]
MKIIDHQPKISCFSPQLLSDLPSSPKISYCYATVAKLRQRLAELEKAEADFLRTKQQLEFEFNQKRAKFKELYLAKEEELKRQNVALQSAEGDVTRLQVQLMEATADMENIKAVATVSETTKQEAINDVKKQWQEEVASMQAIMKETVREYEIQFHQRLEQERTQWGQYKEVMERELADLRRQLSERREEDSLENDMKKAQEDAEKLRSVVVPMEKEIAALKEKLLTAEEKVKELEASKTSETCMRQQLLEPENNTTINMPMSIGEHCQGQMATRGEKVLLISAFKKVKELNHYLETEKSCRTDLEMYVAVLNTQKSVLQEDAEKLRKELHEVCHRLEQERQQYNQLKHTWQRANDQFLESQRLLMRDMQRMENVLTSEQLRQVEELKNKEQAEDEQQNLKKAKESKQPEIEEEGSIMSSQSHVESPAKSLSMLDVEEICGNSIHGSVHSLDSDLSTSVAVSAIKQEGELFRESLRRVQSTDSLGTSSSLQSKSLGCGHKAKSAGNLDESDFGPLVGADSVSENFDTVSVGSFQMSGSFILTKDQEKAIKALTPEQEETASLLSSLTQVVDTAPSGYRMVSEKEWNLLQQEVQNAGNKLGRRCDMCSNYEKQLQGIQVQEAETRDQVKKLQVMLRQANEQLERTMKEKQELEDYVKQSSDDTSSQVTRLVQRAQDADTLLTSLQQLFSQATRSTQEQMAVLIRSREQVSDELMRLQKENESLQGKHSLHSSVLQGENFIPPDTVEELHELVQTYRENIVSVRTAADHLEEKLKAEILFLKEQIQAEQCLKENIEETLQLEIDSCKEEIASYSSLKTELERVKADKDQLEARMQEKIQYLDNLEEVNNSLQEQLKKEGDAKTSLEQLLYEEKNKGQRLQTELDVSEQVQRDFVKLSQTLQVQLERIRQADTLDNVRVILNDTKLTDINQLPET